MQSQSAVKKLVENLQSDLRALSSETKRKYPPVKEAAEAGILKIKTISTKQGDILGGLLSASSEIVQPFLLGCDTKNIRVVQICLSAVQRLIQHEAVSMPAANNIINVLWNLMEAGTEELKLLQTAILLLTTNSVVQHESLAKAIVLCFRLHFAKDSITINTAAATVRQLVSVVFERVVTEDSVQSQERLETVSLDELKVGSKTPPKSLRPCAQDGYLLFQDLCQLVNADQPFWLVGMTEMTRTFGLELMEEVLTSFPNTFLKHPEFSFMLKERVCPLVIKLFSPSLKYRQGVPQLPSPVPAEKPYFPIVLRLLRIVSVLIRHYYALLNTECEIFLSLLVKFLDPEKPMWQRALALEVLLKLCNQPHLLRSFCQSYDMKPHSTKIFRDIVNALGSFIQSLFMSPPTALVVQQGTKAPDTQGQPPSLVAGMPVGSGVTPQAAFVYRGVWIPIVMNVPQNTPKPIFAEMLDKLDPPQIPDGYGISLAFQCLLEIVRGVQLVLEDNKARTKSTSGEDEDSQQNTTETVGKQELEVEKRLVQTLIESSWTGMLAALSLLLDASTDESATEAILKSQQTYASMCGELGMTTPRDAFITSLCKASLPPHYALTVLNGPAAHSPTARNPTGRYGSHDFQPSSTIEAVERSQVVAVGTALPTASLPMGAQQGPVMLTAKNIQCMRSILSVAHCHGGILGSAWHLVLTTLQHLVWILGLKPATGGSLKAAKQATESPNAVITTAIMADLPVLSAMLSRLFESSQYLDDVALHHLIDALCKLSAESMEHSAYTTREPSLFAVAKLLETGLVNLPRVEVLWKPLTAHLLEICQHPNPTMRYWGAEAVTSLVKSSLGYAYDPPLHENVKLQSMLLSPLQSLSSITHPDIRQKQLECVLQILHNNGDSLGPGWPPVLGVIGAVSNDQGEILIRTAFQSLQLVITDFLPIMPSSCLQVVVDVAGRFGLQNQELNISLTSVGLLWNISDFFFQNREKIKYDLKMEPPSDDSSHTMEPFDALWMCLFSKLGELCVDHRPAVRKSSSQTLFSTIGAHGDLLQQATWQAVLWQVLFPLLDKVQKFSKTASSIKQSNDATGNILIHHSRDTAEKQWAETRVMALAGVARVVNSKRRVLQHALSDFPRAWALLLEFIETAALCRNAEVALAALKSLQEVLQNGGNEDPKSGGDSLKNGTVGQQSNGGGGGETKSGTTDSGLDIALWSNAWRVWLSIGTASTQPPPSSNDHGNVYLPAQPFLTALLQIFPVLFEHIKSRFGCADLQKLGSVLKSALSVPVAGEAFSFILPTNMDMNMTPLQEGVLQAVNVLVKEIHQGPESLHTMYPDLYEQLLTFVEYAVVPPRFGKVETKSASQVRGMQSEMVTMNFVPFGEQVLNIVVDIYKATAKHRTVISHHVLHRIIKTLRVPLSSKYGCPSPTTWVLAINSLISVLIVGLPVARKHDVAYEGIWSELASTLEEFLFSKHPTPSTASVEDYQRDEAIDCRVVQVIRDEILPYGAGMPKEFVIKIMHILNQGSIHAATTDAFIDTDSSRKLREEFAKACFETLLQFSFITNAYSMGEGTITDLAVSSMLQRCQGVIKKFVEDERLSGKCPLPRPRMAEMCSVLKAVATLLSSLKKAPQTNIEGNIWTQVIQLYPHLVDCTTSGSPQVSKALKEALHEFRDLLVPPTVVQNGL